MHSKFRCRDSEAPDPVTACSIARVKCSPSEVFLGYHFALLHPPLHYSPIRDTIAAVDEPFDTRPALSRDTFENHVLQFRHSLDRAVARCIGEHDRIGVLLSGGVDSLLVLQAVKRSGHEPVALSWALPGYPESDESILCGRHARAMGVEHDVVPVNHCGIGRNLRQDQTLHWPDCNPYLPFFRALRDRAEERGLTLLLSGDGGDGLCSVHRYRVIDLWRSGSRLKSIGGAISILQKNGLRDQRVRAFAELTGRNPLPPLPAWISANSANDIRSQGQAHSEALRPGQVRASTPGCAPWFDVRYPDFARLPIRYPYRDTALINLALRIPAHHIIGKGGEKRLFLAATESRSDFSLDRRTGLLNSYFLEHFIDRPAFDWRSLLAASCDRWSPFVRTESVQRFLRDSQPTPGQCLLLWRMVCFVIWIEKLALVDESL